MIPTLPPEPSRAAFKGLEFSKNVEILIKLPSGPLVGDAALTARVPSRVRHALEQISCSAIFTPEFLFQPRVNKLDWLGAPAAILFAHGFCDQQIVNALFILKSSFRV